MQRKTSQTFGLIAAAVLAAAPLHAGIIHDNGGPDLNGGNEMTQWIQAEDFTILSPFTLTDIHFWSLELPGAFEGSITYQIYGDAGTEPGAVLAQGTVAPTTRTATGLGAFGASEFEYHLDISPVALAGGTSWLGLHNGLLAQTSRLEFYWESTGANSTLLGQEDQAPFDGGWVDVDDGREHAFYLASDAAAVPEPGTLALLGAGLTALASRRRKHRPS